MFNTAYPYKLVHKKAAAGHGIARKFLYAFSASKRKYFVLVEEFEQHVFVPKFYPASFKGSRNKFNVLVNDFEAATVIRTCINILLDLLKRYPDYSFAFVGVNTISKNSVEEKHCTKRFRIYRALMLNFFDTANWYHFNDAHTSTYLLVPAAKEEVTNYLKEVMYMFTDIYSFLEPNTEI